MNQGKLVEIGPAAQVYSQPKEEYTQALLAAVPVPDPRRMKERKAERRRVAHVLAEAAEEAALAEK
jgi:peptide/nickel transport system ATP-binding protein